MGQSFLQDFPASGATMTCDASEIRPAFCVLKGTQCNLEQGPSQDIVDLVQKQT